MNDSLVLPVAVVATALAFDFTTGIHDTANAMATSIATRALKPKVAVGLCALLNFAGAFLSIKVSLAISSGIVDAGVLDLPTIFAALIGAIAWNLLAWAAGLHSSSSHALIGGLVGAGLVAGRTDAIGLQPDGEGHRSRDPLPADLRPRRTVGHIAPRSLRRRQGDQVTRSYRDGQIGTASLVALAHGTNDARKTMGVITLALVAHASLSGRDFSVPLWAERLAAGSIATGTYVGGWRIIRTIGRRLTEIGPPQGFVAEAANATTLLSSSYFGYPLCTTHVVSGGILGSGIGRRLARVRWGVAGQMALTLPAAAGVLNLADAVGGSTGPVLMAVVAAAAAIAWFLVTQAPRRDHLGGRLMLVAIIDFAALWKIVLAALLVGVGATAILGEGADALERLAAARRTGDTPAVVRDGAVFGLAAIVCPAAAVIGLIAMTHK